MIEIMNFYDSVHGYFAIAMGIITLVSFTIGFGFRLENEKMKRYTPFNDRIIYDEKAFKRNDLLFDYCCRVCGRTMELTVLFALSSRVLVIVLPLLILFIICIKIKGKEE